MAGFVGCHVHCVRDHGQTKSMNGQGSLAERIRSKTDRTDEHRGHGIGNWIVGNTADRQVTDGNQFVVTTQVPGGPVYQTPRVVEVCLRFGLTMAVPGHAAIANLPITVRPGTVTLIAGPSGSGKTLLLSAIARIVPGCVMADAAPFPSDVCVLDAVAPGRPVYEAFGFLTACGLAEPMLWVRGLKQLSAGEQFRARLARAVSIHARKAGSAMLLCDEFTSGLHRRIAKAIAFNLRKLAIRERLTLVIATGQEDLEEDLHPDQVIRLGGMTPVVTRLSTENNDNFELKHSISLRRRLTIESGTLRDYEPFAAMHYRAGDRIGFVDRVFTMRDEQNGEPLGVVVYGHAGLEVKLRNQVTANRFRRNPDLLNHELRTLKRLVIHPDIRGCGLGHWLVAKTLPKVGTRFVECLSVMGAINPVFEKAGMRRIGTVEAGIRQLQTLSALQAAGADPFAADFVSHVCRRPNVRRLVFGAVNRWYRGMTGRETPGSELTAPSALAGTFRQIAGSRPVYFLWAADDKGRKLIDEHRDGPM